MIQSTPLSRQRLPIGIQTLREIREGGYYDVDKTGFALRLIQEGKYYFLSRPHRFGKSLFLDTPPSSRSRSASNSRSISRRSACAAPSRASAAALPS